MQVDKEQLRVLVQVGFMAAMRSRVADAEAIFAAIEGERPTSAAAYVGLAIAYLTVGRNVDALQAIDRGLRVEGQTDLAELHGFRGLVLQLSGRTSESVRALKQAGAQPLALAMLGEA